MALLLLQSNLETCKIVPKPNYKIRLIKLFSPEVLYCMQKHLIDAENVNDNETNSLLVKVIKWYSMEEEMNFFHHVFFRSLWTRSEQAFSSLTNQERLSLIRSIGI